MASNKKHYKRSVDGAKIAAEKKEKTKKFISRIVAVALAAIMMLGIVVAAAFSLY